MARMQKTDLIDPTPSSMLWHYGIGHMPDFLNKWDGPVGWVRWAHRGVYTLSKVEIPKSQQRYVFKKFEFRVDESFPEVLDACADPDRFGKTWISPNLKKGLVKLWELGYAHSWEAWSEGKLVAGLFGVQVGGYVNMMSMFTRVSHAAKCALGRGLIHMRERGFAYCDWGMVPKHSLNYGVEWWPRWKYEHVLATEMLKINPSMTDKRPASPIPWQLKVGAPVVKLARGIRRRTIGESTVEPSPPADAIEHGDMEGGEAVERPVAMKVDDVPPAGDTTGATGMP